MLHGKKLAKKYISIKKEVYLLEIASKFPFFWYYC